MKVDIAAVSSANREALLSEWERHGLMAYTDIVYSQEEGSKKDCIGRVKQFGYDNDRILMVGDSPGDLEAAEDNGVLFFPILFDNEAKCWKEITGTALEKFMEGTYRGEYQRMLIEEFKRNLSDEDPTFLSLKK